jgi:hypothetical protein
MKEIIRMNQLAGLITEGQAKKMMAVLNEFLDPEEEKSLAKKAITDYISKNNLGSIEDIKVHETKSSKDGSTSSSKVTLSTGKVLNFETTHDANGKLVKINQVNPQTPTRNKISGTPNPNKIPGVKVNVKGNEITFSNKSGEFPAEVETDGTIKMELFLPEEEDRNYEEINDGNWEDILGPNHVFVKIANSIPTEVEALGDSIGISFKASDIMN